MAKLLEALKAQGVEITEDVEKAVMVDFVEKKDADLKDTEIDQLKEQIKSRDEDLKTLKEAEGGKVLKSDFEALEKKYREDTAGLTKKLSEQQLESELKIALTSANTKDVDIVAGLIDYSKLSLKEGKLEGLAEQLTGIQKEKAFLFNEAKSEKPAGAYEYNPASGADKSAPATGNALGDAVAEAMAVK